MKLILALGSITKIKKGKPSDSQSQLFKWVGCYNVTEKKKVSSEDIVKQNLCFLKNEWF